MHQINNKDKRWAKQFGDFAENLTMYVLGQLKNMKVALIDHVGADLIATPLWEDSIRYAISVKGRNIPESESKSFNFTEDNITKLEQTSEEFGMIPAVSFVFVDEMEGIKKIRMFVATLKDLKELSSDSNVGFINWSSDGFSIRYTEGKNAHRLSEIKSSNKISYFELQFNYLEDVNVFKSKAKECKADYECKLDEVIQDDNKTYATHMNDTLKYNTFWSKIYGDKHYIEYKGNMYCIVPLSEITGCNYQYTPGSDSYETTIKDWIIKGFNIKTGEQFSVKLMKDCPESSFHSRNTKKIPFTIYDGVIRFFREYDGERGYYTEIIECNIETGKMSSKWVQKKNPDCVMLGVFKAQTGKVHDEVYIMEDYDYEQEKNTVYISDYFRHKVVELKGFSNVEAYNEEYIYYTAESKLYRININTFEIINLSDKLSKMEDILNYYGVDAEKDIIYIQEGYKSTKIIAIDMNNEIVDEIKMPELHNYAKDIGVSKFGFGWGNGAFYNGIKWILKINPEDVPLGGLTGIIVFNKNGTEIGRWLQAKHNEYITSNEMRFFLPSAISIRYEIVDSNGRPVDYSTTSSQERKHWNARILYVSKDSIKDSEAILHYYW